MRTNAIIRIVIWSLVLVVLTGSLVLFLFPWLVTDSIRGTSSVSHVEAAPLATEVTMETPVQILSNEEKLTVPANSIREIEIEWAAGNILIQPSDVDTITISESDVEDAKYAMVWKQKNDKLSILFCEENLISGLGINLGADLTKDLYIYVPLGWECASLEIDAASATVEVYDLTIRELDFDGASGTCDLENCTISDLDIDTASGDVTYSGSLDALDFDAASASFYGDFTNTPSRIDMDGMSGKLDISLPEDTGFTLSMDGMSCHFSSEFETSSSSKNKTLIHGDGRCRIKVDGMSCDVTIRKARMTPTEETVYPITETTAPCTDPTCPEHGHTAENCNDLNCALHHNAENCTDDSCTIHHSQNSSGHGSNHSSGHNSGHH